MPLIEYVGGPLDGVVQAVEKVTPYIEIAQLQMFADKGPDESFQPIKGRYVRQVHTRFGDPFQYRWEGYVPIPEEDRP